MEEAEVRRIKVGNQPSETVNETLSRERKQKQGWWSGSSARAGSLASTRSSVQTPGLAPKQIYSDEDSLLIEQTIFPHVHPVHPGLGIRGSSSSPSVDPMLFCRDLGFVTASNDESHSSKKEDQSP
jgi:hypothetical protein